MGMTMTQKILAAHAGLDHVVAGQLIEANLDVVLANDITAPVAINEFEKCGADAVFDNTRIALVLDHFFGVVGVYIACGVAVASSVPVSYWFYRSKRWMHSVAVR